MKRDFVEISDDEWDNHSFEPSRVLNSSQSAVIPPPIESFAYGSSSTFPEILSDEENLEENLNEMENLEDFVEDATPVVKRSRRFVIDDDDDDFEALELKSSSIELEDGDDDDDEEEFESEKKVVAEEDVVGKALQKCAKISAMLRKELYGSSMANCDSYAEVDVASIRVVTQDDIEAACGANDSGVQLVLKPYQIVGVNFLLLLNRKGVAGVILADEMGLGKTIQAITYLSLLRHMKGESGPHLVVCPASVLENWEREFKRWCPSFNVLLYHGSSRAAYSKKLSSWAKSGRPPPFNVLLVCYSLFERHSAQQKDDRKILKRYKWSCVLMDEAHALKDRNSYRWKNLMSIARDATQRLLLTGTPLQNDLHELWSLLEFMMPDLFATQDVDLKKLLNAEDKDLVARMKSILGPFILRRLKSDVMQQLVQKIQRVEYVCMGKHQDKAYREAIEEYRSASRARIANTSVNAVTNKVYGVLPRRQISNYFVQFRKIANHPLLVRRIYNDEDVARFSKKLYSMGVFGFECNLERVIRELKSYNDFSIHKLLLHNEVSDRKETLTDKHVMASAKCQALAELLPSLKKGGHRVLIFSQWTSMMDILEWTLDVLRLSYKRLDGSTQVTERQTIVDTFNNNPSIFACLLSTRAGGQGITLTGADTVIIHDMDFNPQIDRQAEDRCHRIGQTKPVTVYRLVTKGTVDENIYEIAKRKLVLDAAVLESGTVVDDKSEVSEQTMGEILSAILLG